MTNGKNNSWLYVISGLLITANIVTLAMLWIHKNGHEDKQHFPPAGQDVFSYLSNELKLDKQQQEAYAAMKDAHHEAAQKLQDSIRTTKDALFTLLKQGNVTDDAVMQLGNKEASLNIQLDTLTFHHFQKVRALCNPDQQKKFDNIIQEALRMMGRPQGPPAGPHGGPHDGPPPRPEK